MTCHFQLFDWFIYICLSLMGISHFLFTPTFTGAQVGFKTRPWCTYFMVFFSCGALTPFWGHGIPFWGFTITLFEHTTLSRTLDKWLTHNRNLYLTIHNTHNRQTSMPVVRFEPTFPASKWLQTHAINHAAYYIYECTYMLGVYKSWCQVIMVTKCCALMHKICESSLWNLLFVRWLLDFLKISAPLIYRVIQEESGILWEMILFVILSKKVRMNMGPILNGYGVVTAWNLK